jgi:hypothetical protein
MGILMKFIITTQHSTTHVASNKSGAPDKDKIIV